jgi:hypothetical protein
VLKAGLHGSHMKKWRQRNHHTTKCLLLQGDEGEQLAGAGGSGPLHCSP